LKDFLQALINNRLLMGHTNWVQVKIVDGLMDSILIKGNYISKGDKGIHHEGTTTLRATNMKIIDNYIAGADQQGIYLEYCTAPHVIGNEIKNSLFTSFEGIELDYCTNKSIVSGNRLDFTNSGTGILLYNTDGAAPPFNAIVSNNEVAMRTGSNGGRCVDLSYCDFVSILNNSLRTNSTYNTYSDGIMVRDGGSDIEIINNVAYNTGIGNAIHVTSSAFISTIDYNNWYADGEYVAHWAGTNYADLASLQAYTNKDEHSLSVDPKYLTVDDLRSAQSLFHEAGTPLTEVPYDKDSVPRDASNPDIGAFEFTCVTPDFNVYASTTCFGDTTILIDSSSQIAYGSNMGWDFDGDFLADVYTQNRYDTIKYYFDSYGEHTVNFIVDQIAGCVDLHPVVVTVQSAPILDITATGAYCDTADGTATVGITNDDGGDYSFAWSGDKTDSIATQLSLGTYTVAVTNQYGCVTTGEVTIGEAIKVSYEVLKESTCGVPDGSAVVSATGGVAPYSFVWSDGTQSDTNTALSPGIHYVNVIDADGCYSQGAVFMENDGTGPQVSSGTIVGNDCFGDRLGSIDINVTSGVTPYTFLWSNGETTEDIDGLASGLYSVTVTDTTGCIGAGSFEVSQPSKISASTTVTNANCAGADGKAVITVSGGTKPYAYEWDNGSAFEIAQGLAAGVYSVTITDIEGCQHIEPVIVNNIAGPVVTVDDVTGVGCTITDNGAIDISFAGGQFPFTVSWSSGQTTADISGLTADIYTVTITDDAGCIGFGRAEVKQEPPAMNPICLVTVDTATNTNQVVWEKGSTTDVSHYNIYRETSAKGVYQLIGTSDVDSLSIFNDTLADPSVRSWRYKLSVVDLCGNESELSPHHKTIHLTMNVGLVDNTVNLIWDHYEGFDVPTYSVFREVATTPVTSIAALPATNTSYTDDISAINDNLIYFIEVQAPGDGCTATDFKASTLNSTRSNRKNKFQNTGFKSMTEMYNMIVYPNPSDGIFNLEMDLTTSEDIQLKVFDITGKMVSAREYLNQSYSFRTQIDLTDLPAGLYQVHIKTKNGFIQRMLINQ
jgi:hypothetical protein